MQLQVKDDGTIFLLDGGDEAGRHWLAEHLPDDCIRWGSAYVIEHRYVDDIICGFEHDGGEINILL
jgi:hypothetical protein